MTDRRRGTGKAKGSRLIARIWRGVTSKERADEYLEYLEATGLREYRSTKGNRGVTVLRRDRDSETEFLLLTLWDSYDAIKAFAGLDFEKAVYYPKDKEFLLEVEPLVAHYEVLSTEIARNRPAAPRGGSAPPHS